MAIVRNLAGVRIPDTYLQEKDVPPVILGTSTGIIGLLGQFNRGDANSPVLVASQGELERNFGFYDADLDGYQAVIDMLNNGAGAIRICRVTDGNEDKAAATATKSASGIVTFTARTAGTWGNYITYTIVASGTSSSSSGYVDVTFTFTPPNSLAPVETKTYKLLNMDSTDGTSYLVDIINADPDRLVDATRVSTILNTATPAVVAATSLTGGSNGDDIGNALTDASYVGSSSDEGLSTFEAEEFSVDFITSPRAYSNATAVGTLQAAMITQVENDEVSPRIAVLQPASGMTSANVITLMANIDSDRVVMAYPWVKVFNPFAANGRGREETHAPAMHYAGIMSAQSPHESPSQQTINGILGFERKLSRAEVYDLIVARVMVASSVYGQGFIIRNGNNTSSNGGKNQVSRRRMVNYIAKSLEQGLRPYTSKPHTAELRQNVKTTIEGFLANEFAQGRIGTAGGTKPYGVKCDNDNNPTPVVQANQLIVDVQVSLLAPADMIIVRLDAQQEKIVTLAG